MDDPPLLDEGWGEITRLCAITDMKGCTFGSVMIPTLIPAVVQAVQMFLNYYPFYCGQAAHRELPADDRRDLSEGVDERGPGARRAADHDPRARVARDATECGGGTIASPIGWGGGVSRARAAGPAARSGLPPPVGGAPPGEGWNCFWCPAPNPVRRLTGGDDGQA